MAGFLYAFPKGHLTRESLAGVGFPHAAIAGLPGGGCSVGPDDGQPCRVFSLGTPPSPGGKSPLVGYYDGDQTWVSAGDGAWWIGWDNSAQPGPDDLRKAIDLRSRFVLLGDGNHWEIPVIRSADGYPAVPTVDHINANGAIAIDRVEHQYERLWKLSRKLHDAAESRVYDVMTDAEYWEIVTSSLGLLYRLSRWEIAALKLVNQDTMAAILATILDVELVGA